ncbi:MAG TPA: guanylate kinase [Vicinamibacterales bacterium]|nr:guanylate kinase [Vicinamibacterales bacterium]
MSSSPTGRGLLFVVSAPSGTGKTTVVERLVEVCPHLEKSRSYTSRPRRAGETDGVDYNFLSRPAFEAMVARGEFLEWADVFGNLYGTSRLDTEARLDTGVDLVLVIDVQGARQVRERMKEAVGVFVLPPSFPDLERRLRGRSQDSDGAIARRLDTARHEIAAVDEYDYVVVNDDLERCVNEIAAIVTAERARRSRRRPGIEPIVRTFDSEK